MIMDGQLISGRYRLQEVLGRGGMATVWRGVDERLGRPVAVKLLDRADTADPVMVERFDREARTAGGLTHPNIVAVYDVGIDNGVPYLVMELIDGTSVAALVAGGPLPTDQVVDVARQTCDALAVTATQGVVHRDIKPANILLTTTGTVKVCDFGIARLTHQQADLTAPHTAIGTSAYMAPEQASGAGVDARTDLYAMGCVMYAMLTGQPPFTGENPLTVLWQHQYQPAPPVASLRPDTPADLDALITRLLAKDPADRPASAAEVRDRLGAHAESETVTVPLTRAVPVVSQTRTLPVLDHEATPVTVGGRFRLGPIGIAAVALGAAVLAALTVALLIASPDAASTADDSPSAGTASSAGTTTTDSSAANPSTSSTSTSSPPGTATTDSSRGNPGASARLAALRGVIEEQQQAGHLDEKTAEELTKKLQEVDRELDDGDRGKAAEKLANLRNKLDELHQDGKITSPGYEAVQASLTQLGAALPPAERDEKEKDEKEN
jgi:eukaryotic-like serine/threonine-protein kinase